MAVPRIAALRTPPIGFAHRGASANERENTLAAFTLARRLGASGLESDAWITADGQVVLDHDGFVRRWRRRLPIRAIRGDDLPPHIPTLADLYTTCGGDFDFSLDVKDHDAIDAIITAATEAEQRLGTAVRARLWLCTGSLDTARDWRARYDQVRIVHSTRLGRLAGGPERHAADLADAGADVVNLHFSDWTGGLTTLFHRFGLLAFGWDAQHRRVLDELLDLGIDAVYSNHVDRMVDALAAWYPDARPPSPGDHPTAP